MTTQRRSIEEIFSSLQKYILSTKESERDYKFIINEFNALNNSEDLYKTASTYLSCLRNSLIFDLFNSNKVDLRTSKLYSVYLRKLIYSKEFLTLSEEKRKNILNSLLRLLGRISVHPNSKRFHEMNLRYWSSMSRYILSTLEE